MPERMIERFNQGVDFEGLYTKDVALQYCILTVISRHTGHVNRISKNDLVRKVWNIYAYRLTALRQGPIYMPKAFERKVGDCIRQYRKDGAWIVSTGGTKGGYWKAESLKEVIAFVKAEYNSRSLDMLHTGSKMIKAARRESGGQISMFESSNADRFENKIARAIDALEG